MSQQPGRFCPEHTIEIRASIDKVWGIIANFNAWQGWNPLYVKSEGNLALGESIHFAVALPGLKPHEGSASVISLQVNKQVRYQMLSGGGLVKATRYIELTETEPGFCRVTNGEIMGGLLGPVLYLLVGKRVRQGLAGMNEALKDLAEQN